MSAFDNFMYGAKRCIDTATVKTNEFIETSRVKIERAQLNNTLREEYTKLGKLCYDMSEKDVKDPEKMSRIIAKINRLKEDIELANDHLSSYEEKFCEVCGMTNPAKFQYCSKCGNKLD